MQAGSDKQKPLVSIVLPTYNRATVLPHAIRSVLAQDYDNFELIVVDDNSPDETRDVVHAFDDPRIRYTRNDPNLKLPRALNRGFSLARGHFLTWTSDDNMYAPEAIGKMVARLQAGDCDFVYADYYQFSDTDEQGIPADLRHERLPASLRLEKGNHIGACFMYSRRLYESVGEYDPELFLIEDYDYFLRAARGFRFCHIDEPLYYFRRDEDTLYHSRYCEVKSSDVLVRLKNGVLDPDGAVDTAVNLGMRHLGALKQPLLSRGHSLVSGRSYRLTQWFEKRADAYLRDRFRKSVGELATRYTAGSMTFGEAREQLCAVLRAEVNFGQIRPK